MHNFQNFYLNEDNMRLPFHCSANYNFRYLIFEPQNIIFVHLPFINNELHLYSYILGQATIFCPETKKFRFCNVQR